MISLRRYIAVAALGLISIGASAARTHLLIYPLEGNPYPIVLEDGLTLSMDENTLTVTSDKDPVQFFLDNVARLTYEHVKNASSPNHAIDAPLVYLTSWGLEIGLPGYHKLNIFDTTGRTLWSSEFTDTIAIDKSNLPSALIVIVIDNISVLKLTVR